MSRETLRGISAYIMVVAKVLRLAERPEEMINQSEIEAAADRWAKRKTTSSRKRNVNDWRARFTRHAIRWLTFLGRLQPPSIVKRSYPEHVAQFADYMLQERGLATSTVAARCCKLHKFLVQVDKAGLRLDTLDVDQVDRLLSQRTHDHRYSRATINSWASALRPFFRFAEERGWCQVDLATGLMTPRVTRHEGLPIWPSWDDVSRVLAAANGDRLVDIRDRALLMLLAVYGLRAGEVRILRLEDFDWEQELLTVPPAKRRRPRTYPLCRPVGDAVLRYLREARPCSDRRELSLTLVAPFRPLSTRAVGSVVSRWLHKLGLQLPHYGSHILRHACAFHLLAEGLTLKEIGDHLGHQSPDTTSIYAKVDLAALRTVGDFGLEDLL